MLEQTLIDYFLKVPHVVSVSLFGSFATGNATERSDVDIAVFFERAHVPSLIQLIELREEVSDLIQKDVDLVCLNTASPIIGMQVFQNGKLLLQKNERAYIDYQIALFVDYAELKELRAEAEKNILDRKFYDKS